MDVAVNVSFQHVQDLYFQNKYAEAYDLVNHLAAEGDVRSVRFLGWLYARGHGCARDDEKAMHLFRQAAERGDAEAMYGMASIYYARCDYENAFQCLARSMDAGFVPAIRWCGALYQLGLGVRKDPKRAFDLYHQAARAGNLPGYYQEALMLLKGFKGIQGRITSIPMLIKFLFCATVEAYRDKNSQRLM